jgi:hypothetical protein
MPRSAPNAGRKSAPASTLPRDVAFVGPLFPGALIPRLIPSRAIKRRINKNELVKGRRANSCPIPAGNPSPPVAEFLIDTLAIRNGLNSNQSNAAIISNRHRSGELNNSTSRGTETSQRDAYCRLMRGGRARPVRVLGGGRVSHVSRDLTHGVTRAIRIPNRTAVAG